MGAGGMVVGLFCGREITFLLRSKGWNQDHQVGLTGRKFQIMIRNHFDFIREVRRQHYVVVQASGFREDTQIQVCRWAGILAWML